MMRRIWWLVAVAAVSGCGDDFVGPCVPDDAGNGCTAAPRRTAAARRPRIPARAAPEARTTETAARKPTRGLTPWTMTRARTCHPWTWTRPSRWTRRSRPRTPARTRAPTPARTRRTLDGTQLAPCEAFEEGACAEGLGCYVRGNGPGFCTATCEDDEDCEVLTDAEYTCSTTFGGGQGGNGGMGLCRIECEGENDTESCPGSLECISVGGQGGQGNGGAFRCGYTDDPPDQGEGTVARWGRCTESDPTAQATWFVTAPSRRTPTASAPTPARTTMTAAKTPVGRYRPDLRDAERVPLRLRRGRHLPRRNGSASRTAARIPCAVKFDGSVNQRGAKKTPKTNRGARA